MEKENWYFVTIETIEFKFIQIRKLNTDFDLLKKSGMINPFLGEPLPLRDFEHDNARSIPTEENSEKILRKRFYSWVVI